AAECSRFRPEALRRWSACVAELVGERAPLPHEALDDERGAEDEGGGAREAAPRGQARQRLPRGKTDEGRDEQRLVTVEEDVRHLRAAQQEQPVGQEPGGEEARPAAATEQS